MQLTRPKDLGSQSIFYLILLLQKPIRFNALNGFSLVVNCAIMGNTPDLPISNVGSYPPSIFVSDDDQGILNGREREVVAGSPLYGHHMSPNDIYVGHSDQHFNKESFTESTTSRFLSRFSFSEENIFGPHLDSRTSLSASFFHKEERLHNLIKKVRKDKMFKFPEPSKSSTWTQSTTTGPMLSNDELYALAIIRPNILTSEDYASSFLVPQDVTFIYNSIDKFKDVSLEDVEKWKSFYEEEYPEGSVAIERGISDDQLTSLRFIVFDKDRNLVVLWMFAGKYYSIHYRSVSAVCGLIEHMKSFHETPDRVIRRVYSGKEESLIISNVKIDGSLRVHDEFYPQVLDVGGIKKLIDGFKTSSSNLMIFAGQWGGGKSALFQAMCYEETNHDKTSYYLLDDPNVYAAPSQFSQIIDKIQKDNREGIIPYLFLEESDDFIRDKKNNPFLSRLASLSNGAASLRVKIIIATNDTSENQIDPALTRSGRLYAMIKFGLLTPEQANKARKVVNLEPKDFDKSVTLAEALTEAPIILGVGTSVKTANKVGFTN